MRFDVKKHPTLPLVIGTWYEGFKFARDGLSYDDALKALLDEQTEPVFYIVCMSKLRTISVQGVIDASNYGAHNLKSSYQHPMNRELIFVSQATIIKLAVKGADTPAFGNMKIRLFASLDEALAYVKENA